MVSYVVPVRSTVFVSYDAQQIPLFFLCMCRQITVGMWADFSLKDLGEPFRMWYIFTDFSKKQTKEQERLLKLFRRAKNRKKVLFILKAWKHLVSAVGHSLRFSFMLSYRPRLELAWGRRSVRR